MNTTTLLTIWAILFSATSFAQNYPDNENGSSPDMLTPAYYQAKKKDPFRKQINKFISFARMHISTWTWMRRTT